MFKSSFISIVGRPNVGKSTLLNKLIGEKLSIVSNKPQTTRKNFKAIMQGEYYQLVFLDTPGIHKPRHKLGEYMVKVAEESLKDVDIVVFITNPEDEIRKGDIHILDQIKDLNVPVFLVINKVDENTAEKVAKTIKNYSEAYKFSEVIPISALKGNNVDKLTELMIKYSPEGPQYFPSNMITDEQERTVISEIIREKVLRLVSDEIPHGTAVDIITMSKDKNGTYQIEAVLYCEKESHKGIIIGSKGAMLKKISTFARQDIEKFLGSKVYLNVWVKVKKEWRDKSNILNELGYKL